MLAEGNQITVETVQAAVADSARFDVFGLVDAILNGEAAHALRMLEGLRGEGSSHQSSFGPWRASCACWLGLPSNSAKACRWTRPSARHDHLWDKRRPLVSKALQRLSAQRWAQLLQDAQRIDAQIKGQAEGSPGRGWRGWRC